MVEPSFAITVQAVGTLMVAALLWQLTRLIPGRFLRYWSIAWVCLTVAIFALRMAKSPGIADALRPVVYSCYLVGEYLFGFFLWAGFRDYARDMPTAVHDARVLLLLVPLGMALPWVMPEALIVPIHTALMAAFFAAAFWASIHITRPMVRPSVGLNIVRILLLSLAVIFFAYCPLLAWSHFVESLDVQYTRLSLIYYALIELGLAFGLVVLAAERAQENLEAKNLELAEASRRDALTGLYNRRHFDDLLAANRGQPTPGCIALIDVNDLKVINDSYLHAAGDAALRLVARSLVSRFRVTDPIFRIGGDEFAVVMPTGNETELAARMADIDDSLMNLRVPGIAEPTDIRVAWGVASYSNGDAMPVAFADADKGMYACKLRRKSKPDSVAR